MILPIDVLFNRSSSLMPRLSPDGSYISYLSHLESINSIIVKSVSTSSLFQTYHFDGVIRDYFWCFNSKNIFILSDNNGNEKFRLYLLCLESGEITDISPYNNCHIEIQAYNLVDPYLIFIKVTKADLIYPCLVRLDINTKSYDVIEENYEGKIYDWIFDCNNEVVGKIIKRKASLFLFSETKCECKLIDVWNFELSESLESYYLLEGNSLFVLDNKYTNTTSVSKYDLVSGSRFLVYEDLKYDTDSIILDSSKTELLAICVEKQFPEWAYISRKIESDFKLIKSKLKGCFKIVSTTIDDMYWLLVNYSDITPPQYYIYSRKQSVLKFLFNTRPEIMKYKLNETKPFSFKTTDDIYIDGYISCPKNHTEDKRILIVKIHGGPWTRDIWTFEPEQQFFLSRGYSLMKINYRGSTGYGKRFFDAGNKQWGEFMQQDIYQGINFIIENGYCSVEKVIFYGWSYGGYSALMASADEYELCSGVIAYSPPTNLVTFLRKSHLYWPYFKEFLDTRVGDPDGEESKLWSKSPLHLVNKISAPLLLFQGGEDPRIDVDDTNIFYNALIKYNNKVEYITFPDEGHSLIKSKNIVNFYKRIELFLEKIEKSN
ncbi:prolyl oligopeptidase family serine peptidase [Paenibacillus faecalis]|uniref:S9 family peptidase n=1 Tax=Paenibacillus faecalis TaxID=2079532 RepID=UPI000D0F9EA3|nr:prolyl oligopeptidase family serine peptidase [Paenibacillus faecalis]